jgi:hypothetical protein
MAWYYLVLCHLQNWDARRQKLIGGKLFCCLASQFSRLSKQHESADFAGPKDYSPHSGFRL